MRCLEQSKENQPPANRQKQKIGKSDAQGIRTLAPYGSNLAGYRLNHSAKASQLPSILLSPLRAKRTFAPHHFSFLLQNIDIEITNPSNQYIRKIQMTNLLLRQFTPQVKLTLKQMYIRIYGIKDYRILNQVIPDVSANLLNSSEQFMEALVDMDSEYIQQIATPSLGKILLPEIAKLKQEQVKVKQERVESKSDKHFKKDNQPNTSDLVKFSISPYVIFGQSMQDRLNDQNPWKNLINLFSLNRFIYAKDGLSYERLRDNQIYGFNCYYENLNKDIEVTSRHKKEVFKSKGYVITFETDATNHEFYVSDFNYLVRENVLNQQV